MEPDRSRGQNINQSRNSGLGKTTGNRSRATRKGPRGATPRQPQRPLRPTDRP
jgi:hypothetical protein